MLTTIIFELNREKALSSAPDYDVVIVGFGPVGAVAANLLGRADHRVLIVDREREPFRLPRAIVLDDETMRLFRSIGLLHLIQPFTTPIGTVEFAGPNGERLLGYDVAPDGPKPNGFQPNYFFHQPSVDALVRKSVEALSSVEVCLGTFLANLRQTTETVEVTLNSSLAGLRTVTARYLLGCDGARSTVRSLLEVATCSLGYDERWLVIDAEDLQQSQHAGRVTQICDPERRATVIQAERHHRRWEFQLTEAERTEEATSPEFIWKLLQPWVSAGDIQIVRAAAYRFHSVFAERWSVGRVFLLGDAAHQMPPFMGQGMCTGLRDAGNLAWKLSAVLKGYAPVALLESYSEERIPHARDMVEWSVEVGLLIEAFAARFAGDASRLEAVDASSGYGAGRELAPVRGAWFDRASKHRCIGRTAPFLMLPGEVAVDDLQGDGFAILRRASGPSRSEVSERLGEGLVHIDLDAACWSQLERLAGAPIEASVLVRPDRLVCAVGPVIKHHQLLRAMAPGVLAFRRSRQRAVELN